MLKSLFVKGAAIAATLLSFNTFADVIDLFTDDQAILSAVGTTVSSSATGTSIIGGERDIQVTAGTKVKAEVEVAYGELNIASNLAGYNGNTDALSTIAYEVVVQWDGLDGSSALDEDGLGGMDLTGLSGFLVEVLSSDGFGTFTVQITDTDGNTYSMVYPIIEVDASSPVSFFIAFSDFAGLDFSDIGSIQLTVNGTGNTDIRIASIEAVPEPSGLALMSLALVALAGIGRFKRAAK